MKEIKTDVALVAKCGLYCGACSKYRKGKCQGCSENKKATWCTLRACCIEKEIASCADCNEFDDVMACKKYNTIMAKLFGFVFNSDRAACVNKIKEIGYEQFAQNMTEHKIVSFKKNKPAF